MIRKYSIGFLMIIIIFICFTIYKAEVKNENELRNSPQEVKAEDSYFYIRNEGGYVVVCKSDDTIYEYTSIKIKELPMFMQNEIKNGLRLNSLSEVYGFLENYSS